MHSRNTGLNTRAMNALNAPISQAFQLASLGIYPFQCITRSITLCGQCKWILDAFSIIVRVGFMCILLQYILNTESIFLYSTFGFEIFVR